VRTLGTCLVAAVVAACPLLGQQAPRQPQVLRIGAPIRVTSTDYPDAPLVGVFAGTLGDTILVGLPGGSDAFRLLRASVIRIETRVGRRSAAGAAAVLGMAIGTGVGGIVAAATSPHGLEPSSAGLFLGGGALGAILGGVLGGVVFKAPRWVVVPPEMLTESAEP